MKINIVYIKTFIYLLLFFYRMEFPTMKITNQRLFVLDFISSPNKIHLILTTQKISLKILFLFICFIYLFTDISLPLTC